MPCEPRPPCPNSLGQACRLELCLRLRVKRLAGAGLPSYDSRLELNAQRLLLLLAGLDWRWQKAPLIGRQPRDLLKVLVRCGLGVIEPQAGFRATAKGEALLATWPVTAALDALLDTALARLGNDHNRFAAYVSLIGNAAVASQLGPTPDGLRWAATRRAAAEQAAGLETSALHAARAEILARVQAELHPLAAAVRASAGLPAAPPRQKGAALPASRAGMAARFQAELQPLATAARLSGRSPAAPVGKERAWPPGS